VTEEEAEALFAKHMWALGKRLGAMQVGTKVPVFAITELGREICTVRLRQIGKEARSGPDCPARPLI